MKKIFGLSLRKFLVFLVFCMVLGALFAVINELFFGLNGLVVAGIAGVVIGLVAGIIGRREGKINGK